VLALCVRDLSVAQMGRELLVSPHTVRTHMANILLKVEMHSRSP
jgi:DNA-binding CsgD family transcriptional regulator